MKTHVNNPRTSTDKQNGNATASSRTSAEEGQPQDHQRKMEEACSPGPSHQAFDAFVGEWDAQVKSWCEPGGQPSITQGTAKATWTLAGHFLEEEFHGEMMGRPFTGRTLMGYDNVKQTFNTVWVSDMQTSIFTSEGKGENGNKVITLEGKTSCPVTGRKDIPVKTVLRVIDPDQHVLEMFNDGTKSMEITYNRQRRG